MKNTKKIKIAIIILIIIFGIIYLLITNNLTNNNANEQVLLEQDEESDNTKEILDYNFKEETNAEEFVSIEKAINTYFKECNKEEIENITILLNNTYIEENGIDEENILSKINYYDDFNIFFAEEMYYENSQEEKDEFNVIYYVKGTVFHNSYNEKEEIFICLNIDLTEDIFTIIPQDSVDLETTAFEDIIEEKQQEFLENYSYYEEETLESEEESENTEDESAEEEIREEEITEDELEQTENEINYLYASIDESYIFKRYINKLVIDTLYNENINTYSLITDECKENKFNSKEEFTEYINENARILVNLKVEEISEIYNDDDFNLVYTVTSNNNKYKLYLNNVNNYKISIE